MTPEEKAKELVNKFKSNVYKKAFADTDFMYDRYYGLDDEMAKQCALIAVDDLIKIEPYERRFRLFDKATFCDQTQYWKEVKQEIEAL